MAQPSGAQRVPVVEAEAPAAPPRGKLVLRRQQTQEGAAALLGLAARAPAAAPPADAMEGLPPYEGNDDCTVVTTESGRKPKRPHRKRASGRARARAPAVPVPAAPAPAPAVGWSPDAGGLSIFAGLTGPGAPPRARPLPPPFRAGRPRVALRLDRAAFAGVVDQGTLRYFPGEVLSQTRPAPPPPPPGGARRALFVGDAAPFFDDGAARPAALSALTRIARETGCVVVVSSTAPRGVAAALGAALGAENLRAAAAVAFPGSGLASAAERQVLEVLQWLARRPDGATLRWACLDSTGCLRKAYVDVARAARAAPALASRFVRAPAFDEGTLHAVTTRLDAAAPPRAPPPAPARPAAFAVPVRAPPPLPPPPPPVPVRGRFDQFAFREVPSPAKPSPAKRERRAPASPRSPALKRLRRESASPVLVATV